MRGTKNGYDPKTDTLLVQLPARRRGLLWAEGEVTGVSDARLWHPWLRINRVLRVMLHTRALALKGQIAAHDVAHGV